MDILVICIFIRERIACRQAQWYWPHTDLVQMSRHSQSHGVTILASMCSVEFGVAHDFAIEEKDTHNAACFPGADNKYAKQRRIASENRPISRILKKVTTHRIPPRSVSKIAPRRSGAIFSSHAKAEPNLADASVSSVVAS